MEIKVEPFLMKKGNRVAKAAIKFNDGVLEGFHLIGFTICDDEKKGMFVLFPSSIIRKDESGATKPYFFLRPGDPNGLQRLQDAILDVYESMTEAQFRNSPRIRQKVQDIATQQDAVSN